VILIDTSIIIEFARGKDAKVTALLPTLSAAVCGVMRAEMLCGARDLGHRASLQTLLAAFHQLPIDDVIRDGVGDNLAALRTAGVTVPFSDAFIATVAIENDVELWTRDKQFGHIQSALPALKLFQDAP
jgi:predicted nucleic acid-binding protein